MSATDRTPAPGSDDAVNAGCICPREQGRAFRGEYWRNEACPIHGYAAEVEPDALSPDAQATTERTE